jgi:hypothetical protein
MSDRVTIITIRCDWSGTCEVCMEICTCRKLYTTNKQG